MIKSYTTDIQTTNTLSVAVVGISMFNPNESETTAIIYLKNSDGEVRSQLLEMVIPPKVTAFIDTKVFISGGDTLVLSGLINYTIAGDESVIKV